MRGSIVALVRELLRGVTSTQERMMSDKVVLRKIAGFSMRRTSEEIESSEGYTQIRE